MRGGEKTRSSSTISRTMSNAGWVIDLVGIGGRMSKFSFKSSASYSSASAAKFLLPAFGNIPKELAASLLTLYIVLPGPDGASPASVKVPKAFCLVFPLPVEPEYDAQKMRANARRVRVKKSKTFELRAYLVITPQWRDAASQRLRFCEISRGER